MSGFGKADIEYLVNLLRPKLQHRTRMSHGLSVEDQILITLRFYACGTFYQVVGDYMGVVKSAVCDVVRDVSIFDWPAWAAFPRKHRKSKLIVESIVRWILVVRAVSQSHRS